MEAVIKAELIRHYLELGIIQALDTTNGRERNKRLEVYKGYGLGLIGCPITTYFEASYKNNLEYKGKAHSYNRLHK